MNNWLPLLATLFIQAMVSMALLTLPVMAPVAAKDLAVSPALVGIYVALTYLGAMISSLTSGSSVTRFGPIRVSQLGLILCAMGLCLCAVPWLPATGLGAVLIGLGYGPITPASSQILTRTTPAHQMSLVFSIKQTGVPLGSKLAGAIVPSLMLGIGWQLSLISVALVCLISAILSQPLRHEMDQQRQVSLKLNFKTLLAPIRMVLSHSTAHWPPWPAVHSCSPWFKCLLPLTW